MNISINSTESELHKIENYLYTKKTGYLLERIKIRSSNNHAYSYEELDVVRKNWRKVQKKISRINVKLVVLQAYRQMICR